MASLIDALTYSALLGLMGFGLTLIRRTTGVWNVAHGEVVTVGSYVTLTLTASLAWNPYLTLPMAFLVCAALSGLVFLIGIEPIRARGASAILLLVVTIAISLVLTAAINIYSDYLQNVFHISAKSFLLTRLDFYLWGQPGILWVSWAALAIATGSYYIFLQYTRTGLALRAMVDQPVLATVMGANARSLSLLSWCLAGGATGLAGCLLPLRFQCNPSIGTTMIATMFAVSIFGGTGKMYGPLLAGVVLGFAQIYGIDLLSSWIGPQVIPYKDLIPMIVLVLTLQFLPQGLSGFSRQRG
ncbi:MAG: branched-chain amino acid ABC transporter permease [Synergistota bacterium]|nr:branched-chain amino acid ABC transporter permease [Synergistota bacterium]